MTVWSTKVPNRVLTSLNTKKSYRRQLYEFLKKDKNTNYENILQKQTEGG